MTIPIGGIPSVGVGAVTDVAGVAGAQGGSPAAQGSDGFGAVLASAVDQLQSVQSKADSLGVQAATGDLRDVTDYLIASNEAKLTQEMVVTIKNQAVAAFNEIMRMPI